MKRCRDGTTLLGHVMVEAVLLSPVTGERLAVEALIDAGATFTTLPKAIAERLKLTEVTKRRVRTASGEEVLPESYLMIDIMGEKTTTPILMSEKVDGSFSARSERSPIGRY